MIGVEGWGGGNEVFFVEDADAVEGAGWLCGLGFFGVFFVVKGSCEDFLGCEVCGAEEGEEGGVEGADYQNGLRTWEVGDLAQEGEELCACVYFEDIIVVGMRGGGLMVFVGGEDPAFGFGSEVAVDVGCGEGVWWGGGGGGGRECGEDVGGWGGRVELEAAEEGEGEGEVGEEVGGEGLEGGGVVVDLGEGGGHCGRSMRDYIAGGGNGFYWRRVVMVFS